MLWSVPLHRSSVANYSLWKVLDEVGKLALANLAFIIILALGVLGALIVLLAVVVGVILTQEDSHTPTVLDIHLRFENRQPCEWQGEQDAHDTPIEASIGLFREEPAGVRATSIVSYAFFVPGYAAWTTHSSGAMKNSTRLSGGG